MNMKPLCFFPTAVPHCTVTGRLDCSVISDLKEQWEHKGNEDGPSGRSRKISQSNKTPELSYQLRVSIGKGEKRGKGSSCGQSTYARAQKWEMSALKRSQGAPCGWVMDREWREEIVD